MEVLQESPSGRMSGEGISIHVTVLEALLVGQDIEDSDIYDSDFVKEQSNVYLYILFFPRS